MDFKDHHPVIGICGYSGSGKTTLVEQLIPALRARGLAVGVVKHDAHGMSVDREGKDTDRFFRAGAAVVGHDPEQIFFRSRLGDGDTLQQPVAMLLETCDLVLVEGHKDTALPLKIWLEGETGTPPAPQGTPWAARLGRDADRGAAALKLIASRLQQALLARPVRGGLLLGGSSTRMGSPKQLLLHEGVTWAERIAKALADAVGEVCLLGSGPVPEALAHTTVLPDIPDRAGPLAGMLAAMRWDPTATWVFLPTDMPLMTAPALLWLLDQRKPGCRAIMPRLEGSGPPQPLGAWYDPRMVPVLEECRGPQGAAGQKGVVTPMVPEALAQAWRGFNSPDEIAGLVSG